MATSHADHEVWQREQNFISQKRKENRELFASSDKGAFDLYDRIGITSHPPALPKGYVKYSPLDFIVEEIRPDGTLMTVDGQPAAPETPDGEGTIYADLTKLGISTLDAVQRMVDALGVPQDKIGYAGIKDAVALTAQRISIRGGSLEAVKNLAITGCQFRQVVDGKGVISTGNLKGNRFTLLIRTEGEPDKEAFAAAIELVKTRGVMNYYGTQRFGTPRFLAHLFGAHIMRGDLESLIKAYLMQPSPYELPFYANIRAEAAAAYGDFPKMQEIMGVLPYSFRYELQMLEELVKNPTGYEAAMNRMQKQADLWARAYASYLTNMILADAEKNGTVLPERIPLLMTQEPEAKQFYASWLKQHGTEKYMENLKRFRFINVGKNQTIEPVIRPTIHDYKFVPEGLVISFDLPKGAYATTILMYLFDSVSGTPIPEWMKTTEVDTKELLGTGSLLHVREQFAAEIVSAMANKTDDE
ncbi:MAG: tRNA pseudouridine(13) synthase TruD [Candidatus Uhrbacteria bacterium]